MSNITLNIVEPSSPTPINPVDPGTGTVVPDTGLFTSGIGGAEAAVIATIALVVILAIVGAIIYYRKHKQGNISNIFAKCKQTLKTKKYASGLAVLALLVSIGTVAGLLKLGASAEEADSAEAQDSTALTVTAESEELTIELGDEPVFAVLPVELTVAEATQAGYTLTAYAENTDLVSTTDSSKTVPMVVADEGELVVLADNTYGLALAEPENKDSEAYTALSTDSLNPTIIKSMAEYAPTEENDTTTIYYGFYITPDIPYGTYTGSDIYYDATINTTLVTFDGNGLYFNEDETQTTNEVTYINVPVEESGENNTINQIISGEYLEPSQALPYIFLGWSTDPEATVPTYETEDKIAEFLPISPNTPITLYAVWQKATTITFDANDGTGDKTTQTIIAGESDNLNPNEFTREGYTFTGWNTDPEGEGRAYADEAEYTAPADSGYVTLYAQWEEDVLYMQNVATWGSSLAAGNEITVVDSRDGKGYTVARLADGNIWMTQNLDHNIGDIDGGTYTSADTDLPSNATWTPTSSETTYATGTTTWNNSTTTPESYDPGDLYWNGGMIYDQATCVEYGGEWVNNAWCERPNPTSSIGDSHYHLGNYYNWTAAVAMRDSSAYTKENDVNQSICPAGWTLPSGYAGPPAYSGSFQYLLNKANFTGGLSGNIHIAPGWFFYGGGWNGGSDKVGMNGRYWSRRVYDSGYSYQLYLYISRPSDGGGGVNNNSNGGRRNGYSIRCIAR